MDLSPSNFVLLCLAILTARPTAMSQPDLSGWNRLVRQMEQALWVSDLERMEPGCVLGMFEPRLNPDRFKTRSAWADGLTAQLEALPLAEHHADRALQVLLADGMRAFSLVQTAADRHRAEVEAAFEADGLPREWGLLPMALTGWDGAYYGPGRRAGPWAMDLVSALSHQLEIRRGWDERHVMEKMTLAAVAQARQATAAFPGDPMKQVLAFVRGVQAAQRFDVEQVDAELLEWLHLLRVLLQTDRNFDRDNAHSLWLMRDQQWSTVSCPESSFFHFSLLDVSPAVLRALKEENPWYTSDSVAFNPLRPAMLTPQGATGWVPLDALPCGRSPDRNVPRPVVRHQVQPGEVLGTIARDYRVRIDEIIAHNGLSGDLIRVGQWLEIPGGLPGPKQETPPKASSDPAGPAADSNTPWVWHTVQPGESYWSISTQYPQATMESLLRMNDIAPEALRPGMKVRIPPP